MNRGDKIITTSAEKRIRWSYLLRRTISVVAPHPDSAACSGTLGLNRWSPSVVGGYRAALVLLSVNMGTWHRPTRIARGLTAPNVLGFYALRSCYLLHWVQVVALRHKRWVNDRALTVWFREIVNLLDRLIY